MARREENRFFSVCITLLISMHSMKVRVAEAKSTNSD
jgi:hypothetical protein